MMVEIIDLSLLIDNECMTCGTPWHANVNVESMGTLESVGRNTSRIVLGSHSATHMDAPKHFFSEKQGIDTIDLQKCIGEITCVNFQSFDKNKVEVSDLINLKISERMLFAFGWFKYWKTKRYYDKFPYFSRDAVEYLVEHGMKLMALDTPSPDNGQAILEKDDSPNHKYLLSRDIIIIEYLTNTSSIDFSKKHELIAMPLKIKDCDGSPARVIVKEM